MRTKYHFKKYLKGFLPEEFEQLKEAISETNVLENNKSKLLFEKIFDKLHGLLYFDSFKKEVIIIDKNNLYRKGNNINLKCDYGNVYVGQISNGKLVNILIRRIYPSSKADDLNKLIDLLGKLDQLSRETIMLGNGYISPNDI